MRYSWFQRANNRFVATAVISSVMLTLTLTACGGGGSTSGNTNCSSLPKLNSVKKVGFSQSESTGAWRIAETTSMKAESDKRGYQWVITQANASSAQQVQDVDTLISDKVDVIFLAPETSDALAPAVVKARKACIPVFLVDRDVNHDQAVPGTDFVTFLGSDFEQQGQKAADQLITATGGKGNVIELEGTTGASAATLRKKGFDEELKAKAPGMTIVASQTANFDRATGQKTMETLLQAHPDVAGVFGANDEMAIGAIAALKAGGKKPGQDVKVVSIDGTKDAINLVLAGDEYAVIESNPHFGPLAFSTMDKYHNGETIPQWVKVSDRTFLKADGSAEAYLPEAF